MKTVNLKETELKEAQKLIEQYRDIESELTSVLTELEKLESSKDMWMRELDQTKLQEQSFFSELEKKYGKGKLDILTMKYLVL